MLSRQNILSYVGKVKEQVMADKDARPSYANYDKARGMLSHLDLDIDHRAIAHDTELSQSVAAASSMLRDYVEQAGYWQKALDYQESLDSYVFQQQSRTSITVNLDSIHDEYARPPKRTTVSALERLVNSCRTFPVSQDFQKLADYFLNNGEELDFSQYFFARQAAEDLFGSKAAEYAVQSGRITQEQYDDLKKRTELCLKKNHYRLLAEKKRRELQCAKGFYSQISSMRDSGAYQRQAESQSPGPQPAHAAACSSASGSRHDAGQGSKKPGFFSRLKDRLYTAARPAQSPATVTE